MHESRVHVCTHGEPLIRQRQPYVRCVYYNNRIKIATRYCGVRGGSKCNLPVHRT